jgi:hypothetical protein
MYKDDDIVTVRSSGSIFWNGTEYKPRRGSDEVRIPFAAVRHIQSHVYTDYAQYPFSQGGAVSNGRTVKLEIVETVADPKAK